MTQVVCKRLTAALSALAMLSATTLAAPKEDENLSWGRFAWQSGDYEQASKRLSQFNIEHRELRTPEVDYMLGTAWCRIDGLEAKCESLLRSALERKPPAAYAPKFEFELKKCTVNIAAAPNRRIKEPPGKIHDGASTKSIGNNPIPKREFPS